VYISKQIVVSPERCHPVIHVTFSLDLSNVTPRSRNRLQNLMISELLIKFPSSYKTRHLITVLSWASPWTLT
jgi:hypothetical protein